MAYNETERPGTLNLRGRGEYVNTKIRTSDRQISEQAEPRDYDPLRSDIWNLHRSSYNRIADLSHNQFHSTTREALDRTVRERSRLPADRSHPLHLVRSFAVTDSALGRQLHQLETGVLPAHPADHDKRDMKSTYRESYGGDRDRTGTEREPRCQPSQSADRWMQFRRRKSWLFDTDQAPTQFADDALTCPPIPKQVRACVEAAQPTGAACRTMDELEKQVAALRHKLDEARYPAPTTEPLPPSEPRDPSEQTHPGDPQNQALRGDPTEAAEPPPATPQEGSTETCEPAQPSRQTEDASEGTEPGGKSVGSRGRAVASQADSETQGVSESGPMSSISPANPVDPEYPTAQRLEGSCAPPARDLSEIFPCPDTTQCPPPPPPPTPPPCPRGPVPCPAVPVVPGCRAVPPEPGRYRSTYTAGYSDPEAGLGRAAVPRAGRELYRGPAPLPRAQVKVDARPQVQSQPQVSSQAQPQPQLQSASQSHGQSQRQLQPQREPQQQQHQSPHFTTDHLTDTAQQSQPYSQPQLQPQSGTHSQPPPQSLSQPQLAAGTPRCRDGLARAVATDTEPQPGPAAAAACRESV